MLRYVRTAPLLVRPLPLPALLWLSFLLPLSFQAAVLAAPNKGPTQLTLPISAVGRDCFPSTSMERIFSENIRRLYKPLMSEMINIRATKFSHSLVLSTLLSSPTGTYRQACFHVVDLCLVLCEFFIPFGTAMSFLCPSSTLLPLCPDRAWTHHSWSCSCPVCRPQHICRRTGKLWGSCWRHEDLQPRGFQSKNNFDNLEDSWHSFPQYYLFNYHLHQYILCFIYIYL